MKFEEMINKIILGDCMDYLKNIPDKSIDLVLTDPPYGIKADKGVGGNNLGKVKKYDDDWDSETPKQEVFDELFRIGKKVIIFGGNYFVELEKCYKGILNNAYRVLKKNGLLIFKCQDYTDSKTTMTHCKVYEWATEIGFYAKDIAILVLPNKVYNGNTMQRHLRKIHTYFWVLIKR